MFQFLFAEWITEDLLTKVAKNEKMTKWLADPRMSHVLEEFQKNPTAAQAKYADNPEISDFFKQFAGLLGKIMLFKKFESL